MAHQIEATFVPDGLAVTGAFLKVEMSPMAALPTPAVGPVTLYTVDMDNCTALATIDHSNGNRRSLTHLIGGNADESFFTALARFISEDTTIISMNGKAGSSFGLDITVSQTKDRLESAMKAQRKSTDHLNWVTKYTDEDDDNNIPNVLAGSFVLLPDGRFGRKRG